MAAKIDLIQVLRGIAAALVLFWHSSVFLGPYGAGIGGQLFNSAPSMGVDLFFVISGFIMVISTVKNDGSFSYFVQFMIRRVSRVWPLYAVASIAAFSLFTDQNILRLLKSILFIPQNNENAPSFGWPSLNVGWTLNYEMYFYAVFAVSMLFNRFQKIAASLWFVITLILFPYLTRGLSLDVELYDGNLPVVLNFISNPIVWLFFAGMIVGWLYLHMSQYIAPEHAKYPFIAASLFFMWQYGMQFFSSHGINNAGMSIIPLVVSSVFFSASNECKCPPFMVYMGRISFSLYLSHPFVIAAYYAMAQYLGATDPTGGYVNFIFVCVISIIFAHLVHKVIEEPLSLLIRRLLMLLWRLQKLNVVRDNIG